MKDMRVIPRKVGPRVKIFFVKYRRSAISEKDYTAKSNYAQNSPFLPFLAIYYPVVCQRAGLEPKFFGRKRISSKR
jgi:hypothetical protein